MDWNVPKFGSRWNEKFFVLVCIPFHLSPNSSQRSEFAKKREKWLEELYVTIMCRIMERKKKIKKKKKRKEENGWKNCNGF